MALYSWNGFSNYDVIAAQYLYPYQSLDRWLTSPEAKFPFRILLPNDYAFTITWNNQLVSASTVKLEVYQKNVLKGVITNAASNTGSYSANFGAFLNPSSENQYQIKIISNDDQSISDMSSLFYIVRD